MWHHERVLDAGQKRALREDGAIMVAGLLDPSTLERCRKCYDWSLANPGPLAVRVFPGTQHEHRNDNANPVALPVYRELLQTAPFAELLADAWGSKNVWYFAEEIFEKTGGRVGRSPWHQDTSYLPWAGEHWANFWISFERASNLAVWDTAWTFIAPRRSRPRLTRSQWR